MKILRKGCGCGCLIAIIVIVLIAAGLYLGVSSVAEEGQTFFDALTQMLGFGEKAEEAVAA